MTRDIGTLFPELDRDISAFAAGILPSQDISRLVDEGVVRSAVPVAQDQIQPASLDLRLGAVAYRVRASFLPGRGTRVADRIETVRMHEIDLSRGAVLERGCVYIVPLMEELALPQGLSAKSNPKSSTGRLDVFTRLIADGGTEFERVPEGYHGPLYLEIVPRTFSVVLRQGSTLNQMRFVRGVAPSSDAALGELDSRETLVYLDDGSPQQALISDGLWLSIDLQGVDGSEIIGWRARHHAPLIDLSLIAHYDPAEFWDPIRRSAGRDLVLNPGDFYILASRERIRVPPHYSAAMVAYDPAVGEFRIHYAGFFDPGFGYGTNDIKGTRAVLEVRSHEVPFLVEHGQVVGRLIYEPLLAPPDKVYGVGIGSSYQRQGLALSKHFRRP